MNINEDDNIFKYIYAENVIATGTLLNDRSMYIYYKCKKLSSV